MKEDCIFCKIADKEAEATVVGVNDRRGIILDRTVFYATGGGQPGAR